MPLIQPPLPVDPWYASGTFWAFAAVAVALVVAPITIWATFRSARPRRSLHITMVSVVSLMRTAPGLHGRTEVRFDGRVLAKPYIVIVDVVSRSSLDIAPESFGGDPLVLEFGVPVTTLLEKHTDARRMGVREPNIDVVGTALHLGPALLTRRHQLRYTVLLDGAPQFYPVGQLSDVVLREEPAPSPLTRSARNRLYIFFATVFAVLLTFIANLDGSIKFIEVLFNGQ